MSDLQETAPGGEAEESERSCPMCGRSFPQTFAVCPHDATPLSEPGAGHEDPLVGIVLAGSYRIIGVIGEGGMARLYEAEHVRLGTRCAVKVIHDDLAKSSELLARFEREAQAVARIQSPHIVRVIDILKTPDGRPCMITELLDGEDLQARLDRLTRATPRRAIPIARQICRALAAAHDRGVVHRDLKPSNVFLCRDGGEVVAKVLDFGVAKTDDNSELTKTGAIVGTLAYMAPEQAKRAADVGPLADIYTVGAVLYHMLTGEPPYGKDPKVNPLVLLLGGPPKAPRAIHPAIPVGVEAVIQRAMARDPDERPQSALELEAELAAFDKENLAPEPPPSISADGDGDEPAPTPVKSRPSAEDIARQARQTRPRALALSAAAVAGAGLYAAALLTMLLSGDGGQTGTERALILLISLGAAVGVAAVLLRSLRSRWSSLPAVQKTMRPVARALLAGVLTFGGLELAAIGFAAITVGPMTATGWTLRLVATGGAAVVGLLWPRIRPRFKGL